MKTEKDFNEKQSIVKAEAECNKRLRKRTKREEE